VGKVDSPFSLPDWSLIGESRANVFHEISPLPRDPDLYIGRTGFVTPDDHIEAAKRNRKVSCFVTNHRVEVLPGSGRHCLLQLPRPSFHAPAAVLFAAHLANSLVVNALFRQGLSFNDGSALLDRIDW
jgi:hypothetical protein